ncbi:uncharacterized protein [Gossypium hirsutum]|uniref:GAG-pre-integrase domain-containing protein n=1 Tax=Gossypium hirsutum TaxID=3635 RepID=A0A1U8L0Z8_GOSHI|nr:uncharacterized protein LOC107921317 [Gossypium hirsutum]
MLPIPPLLYLYSLLYLQALPSLTMIGTAKVLHGLYILDSPAQTLSITTPIALSATNTSCSIWHPRLGHLSDSRLKLLSPYIPSLSISPNAPCKACHLAKQKKISFPVSTSVSNEKFALVHMDI